MYEGRTSYTIQSASISNYFAELREDVIGAYYGFYFLEFASYYTKEFNDEREMLKLLYQTMRALINPHIPNLLIRYIFELRTGASGVPVCPVREHRQAGCVQRSQGRTRMQ